jgi:hypothetical protein
MKSVKTLNGIVTLEKCVKFKDSGLLGTETLSLGSISLEYLYWTTELYHKPAKEI